jgi:hypothetical protein
VNQRSVHFRLVLKGPRRSLKQPVVQRLRRALATSGLVGHLRIEPYEKRGERNTVVSGALTSSAPLERIVMRLAHGEWSFSLHPDDRDATWDVRARGNDRGSAIVPELLWAHVQRYRDSRPYPFVGPVDPENTKRPVPWSKRPRSIRRLWPKLEAWSHGWDVVDDWDADLYALGICQGGNPRRRVYISTWKMRPGRYYFECEAPRGRAATDYKVVAKGEDVDLQMLLAAMERHLGKRKTPMGG